MANTPKLHEMLRYIPDINPGDPVPPWFFVEFIPKEILKEIVMIGLERQRAVLDANMAANKRTTEALSKIRM